jgi:hypothetical protein
MPEPAPSSETVRIHQAVDAAVAAYRAGKYGEVGPCASGS